MKNKTDLGADQVKWIANALDTKFKVGPLRFGWDSILGVIPGVGDTVTSLASTFIIYQAYAHGMSASTMARMTVNVFLDTLLGAIPLLGDFVDIFWKSNQKNAKLFANELTDPKKGKALSTVWLVVFAVMVIASIALAIYLPLKIIAILMTSMQ